MGNTKEMPCSRKPPACFARHIFYVVRMEFDPDTPGSCHLQPLTYTLATRYDQILKSVSSS